MKITFLGTSHGITEPTRFTSSILLSVKDKRYLIDAGAPIMKLLGEKGVDLKALSSIFITHAHQDHYIGLVEFTAQVELFNEFSGVNVTVYGPENLPFYEMKKFLFGSEGDIDFSVRRGGSRREFLPDGTRIKFEPYGDGEFFDDGTLKLTSIPTLHFPHSHAFLAEAEGKRILFTGDLRHDLKDFPKIAFEEELDLIVTEAAHPLLSSPEIIEVFRGVKTKKILITHVCEARNNADAIAALRSSLGQEKIVGAVFDGAEFTV